MAPPAESLQRARHHHRLLERRAPLVEPPGKPSHREPSAAVPVAERDERGQLERIGEVEAAELPGDDLSHDKVPSLEGPAKLCGRVSVVAQVERPSRGRIARA